MPTQTTQPDHAPEAAGASGYERATIVRSRVERVEATDVTARTAALGGVRADDVAVSGGFVGGARADRVTVEIGALGGALANEVTVTQGVVGSVLARDVRLEQAAARTVVGGRVTMGPTSGAFIVLAAKVDGDVKSFLDPRAGLALVGVVAVLGLLMRVRRVVAG